MTEVLRNDSKQRKVFTSLEQEAFLGIARAAATLRDSMEDVLRASDITLTQYNVLRILRGAEGGLTRNEIRDRLVNRMPDVTRLLDRMEDAGLVTRIRGSEDRRCVGTHLTRAGRALVDSLDTPVEAHHKASLGHMTRVQLRHLIELLAVARKA